MKEAPITGYNAWSYRSDE